MYSNLPSDMKFMIFSFLIPHWDEKKTILWKAKGNAKGNVKLLHQLMKTDFDITYYDLLEQSDTLIVLLHKLRISYSNMCNTYLYVNLKRFEPAMFWNRLYDLHFPTRTSFEKVVRTCAYILDIPLSNIPDALVFLLDLYSTITIRDIYKLRKQINHTIPHKDTMELLLLDYLKV